MTATMPAAAGSPILSVRHNLELGAVAIPGVTDLDRRMEAAMDRFPMLRQKADAQASTLSGGQQKILEVARGLLLDPRLVLIDEPSIGLSPIMVQEVFDILKDLRARGVSVLLIEQNACLACGIPVLVEKPVIDAADGVRIPAATLAVHAAAAVQPQRAVSPPSTGRSTPLI